MAMPFYTYNWLKPDGSEGVDTIEAASLTAAAAQLRSRHIMVTNISDTGPVGGALRAALPSIGWVGTNDVVLLFTQLAALIKAGVTLVAALQVLEDQAKSGRLRYILMTIRSEVEQGNTFAAALRRFPRVFSPVVVSMIEAGEVGGILDIVLERVATMLENRATFRAQLLTSMIYPLLVLGVAVLAVIMVIFLVIPRLEVFIKTLGGRFASSTMALLAVKDFVHDYGAFIACGLAVIAIILYSVNKTSGGRYAIDRAKMHLPVIGPLFLYSSIIQFSRNLASLLNSGVPMLVALETIRETIGNEAFARLIDVLHDRVNQGDSLSKPLAASGIAPPMLSGMVAVGEETGGLDRSLDLVADIYEKLLQKRMHRLNVIIEPVLTVMVFSIVFFIGMSMLSAVWSVYSVL